MDELAKEANEVQSAISAALQQLKINDLDLTLGKLRQTSQEPNFWDDSSHAQDVMKQIAKLAP